MYRLQSSSYSTLSPYYTPQVRAILQKIGGNNLSTIVDATCHIGGDTILFAQLFPSSLIHAVDCDERAIHCIYRNIRQYGVEGRVQLYHSDCATWISQRRIVADLYYFDPPWGGPQYLREKELYLSLDSRPIDSLVNEVLQTGLAPQVLLKAPRNFDLARFHREIKGKIEIYPIYRAPSGIAYLLIQISV